MELLALPPPPKKVKGWTLRQVTPLSTNISLLSYPPSSGLGVEAVPVAGGAAGTTTAALAGTASWPALRVSYLLPVNTVIRDNPPVVGWWDQVFIARKRKH